MRLWERRLALCLFGIALLIAVSTCFAAWSRDDRRLLYMSVLCPPQWHATMSQRYDDRRWGGVITKSTWITKCY